MDTTNQSNNESKTLEEIQNYNYLLLSIYFYLKHNNYNITAEKLFNEANLKGIFTFPQEVNEGTSLYEKLIKKFIQYFYYNTYFNSEPPDDTISDFWNNFWEIFAKKMKNGNKYNSLIDNYIEKEKNSLILTCKILFIKIIDKGYNDSH